MAFYLASVSSMFKYLSWMVRWLARKQPPSTGINEFLSVVLLFHTYLIRYSFIIHALLQTLYCHVDCDIGGNATTFLY